MISNSARSDTIYLKNGKEMEGLIKSENSTKIKLDMGFGTISISKNKIKSIKRSGEKESEQLREKWAKDAQIREEAARQQRKAEQQIMQRQKLMRKIKKRTNGGRRNANVKYIKKQSGIGVRALIDGKVYAELLVDTGASSVFLSRRIADMLGISVFHGQITNVQVADGRIVKAVQVYLKSVSIKGMEARDVMAHILLNDPGLDNWDGLLGMSFLGHFIFHVDAANQELILERK